MYGDNVLDRLPQIIGDYGRKILFISGRSSLRQNKAFQAIYPKIKPYIANHRAGVPPNPDISDILEILEYLRSYQQKYDAILAIGGGSVIDAAKAVSALYGNRSLSIEGLRKAIVDKKFAIKKLPVIAVPTTAGTGSETNPWATIWDRAMNTRHSIGDETMFPVCAVVDARLSATMPTKVAVSSGLDALCHAMEGFWAKKGNAVSRLYSAKAISLVLNHLEQAVKYPDLIKHKQGMALASALSGVSLSIAKTTLCHAISYPLTLKYKVDHGIACAITLNEVYQYNKGSFADEDILTELIVKGIHHQSLGNYVKNLCSLASIPTRLADYGITRESLPELAEKSYSPNNIANNPKDAGAEDILDLLKKVY